MGGRVARQFSEQLVHGYGEAGGLLRQNGFPENFIVVNPQFGSVQLHGKR